MVFIRNKLFFFLLFFFFTINVKAQEYNLTRETYDNIYYVQNGLPEHYGSDNQFKFEIDGITSYCVDPKAPIKSYIYYGMPLDDTSYDDNTRDYLKKVMYFGYDYPGHQDIRYYMAAQSLIWSRLSNYLIEFYTERYGYGNIIDISSEIDEINYLISHYDDVPNFINNIREYSSINSLEYNDYLLNDYEILYSSYDKIKLEGRSLQLYDLDKFSGIINISLKKKNYRTDISNFYFMEGSQSMISGGMIDKIINFDIKINNYSNLEIRKVDSVSKLPLKNSKTKFRIKNKEKGEYVYVNNSNDLQVDSEGILLVNLEHGNYEIEEIDTDDNYELNTNKYDVTIDSSCNSKCSIDIENELKKYEINITKYAESLNLKNLVITNKILKNVEFSLEAFSDIITPSGIITKGSVVSQGKTNSDGKISFSNLYSGNYCLFEITKYDNYENLEPNCFILDENKNIEIVNKLKKANLKVKKIDTKSGLPLLNSNTKFTLKNVDKNRYVYINDSKELSINEDGYLIIDGLEYGNYILEEINSDLNYYKSDEIKEISLFEDTEIVFDNSRKEGNILIEKIDESSKLGIKDIEFCLYANEDIKTLDGIIHYKKDELVSCLVTDKLGYADFFALELGKYYLKESKNDYYLDNDEIYYFDLLENNSIHYTIKNKLKKYNLKIIKYGEVFNYSKLEYNKEFLKNAEFNIYANEDIITLDGVIHYKKDELVKSIKTNKDGIIDINLILGNYYITENKIEGYLKNDEIYYIDLKKDTEIIVDNFIEKSDLIIEKIDEYGNKLSNIQFEIFKGNTSLGIYTTNEEGIIKIDNLPIDIYKIKEVSTLHNLKKDTTSYKIDLNKDKKIVITNYYKKKLPNTYKNDYYNIISIILFVIGLFIIRYEKV